MPKVRNFQIPASYKKKKKGGGDIQLLTNQITKETQAVMITGISQR